MTTPIQAESTSFIKIKENLRAEIQRQIEAGNVLFRDLHDLSSITIIEELLAGFSAYNSFTAHANRRETYIHYCDIRNSAIAIAQSNGYSVFQGKNDSFEGTFVPLVAGVLEPYKAFAAYNQYFVTYLGHVDTNGNLIREAITVNIDEPVRIVFCIGQLLKKTLTAVAGQLLFRFDATDMTEDYFFTINDVIIPHSNSFKDLFDGKLIAMSNAYGGVDVFNWYDISSIDILNGDVLNWYYIERVNGEQYRFESFLSDNGVFQDVTYFNTNQVEEPLLSIQVKAPIARELSGAIKSRNDFPKQVRLLLGNAIDTNAIDSVPGYMNVTYLLNDESKLTELEKQDLQQRLNRYRVFGIAPCRIIDPRLRNLIITVQMSFLDKNKFDDFNPEEATDKIIRDYFQFKLGFSYNLEDVEHELERLPNVKIARITLNDTVPLDWHEYYTSVQLLFRYV